MRTLICWILLLFTISVDAESLKLLDIYDTITIVETNKKPDAIGDNGKAWGIAQIHKIAIDDVNRIYGTSYAHADAFDETCAEEIFILYISAGISRFAKKYKRLPTELEIARMWNGGIYTGYKKQATIKYSNKYEHAKQRKSAIKRSSRRSESKNRSQNIPRTYKETTMGREKEI